MPLIYTLARIFTSEEARYQGKPLYQEIIDLVVRQKVSARVHVTKGIAGCYENGEVATFGVEVFSFHMPLEIIVIMPQSESARCCPSWRRWWTKGLMTVEDQDVHWHKCRKQMIPRQVRVKDVMTPRPRTLPMDAPATEALRILLGARFHGIPVVDAQKRPVGMITQGDLLRQTPFPLKLGSLRPFQASHLEALEKLLDGKRVADLMSRPAVVVREDELLAKAVDLMLMKDVKRLPVVAADGSLTGMLSRLDVFKTIMERNPDWSSFDQGGVQLQDIRLVKEAMRTDTPTLPPSAPTWDAIKLIDTTPIKRVAVVDPDGKLLGLISEKVLLAAFSAHTGGHAGPDPGQSLLPGPGPQAQGPAQGPAGPDGRGGHAHGHPFGAGGRPHRGGPAADGREEAQADSRPGRPGAPQGDADPGLPDADDQGPPAGVAPAGEANVH